MFYNTLQLAGQLLLFCFLFDSSDDYTYSDESNSSYSIKDCVYIYFPTIRYQIPYVICITISKLQSAPYIYFIELSLLLSRLYAPFLIKCYYRQLFVFSITENIILVEITRTNGTGLLNRPMKA